MTKTVKKRLQAVVALLVSLMIMVGIVPSSALNTTVYAANTVIESLDGSKHYVFFDLNNGTSADWEGHYATWNEDIKIWYYGASDPYWFSMEKVYFNAWNRYIYCYGFSTLPSSIRFGTNSAGGYSDYDNQTTSVSPEENKIYQFKNDWGGDGWKVEIQDTYTGGASGYGTTVQDNGDTAAAQQRNDSSLAATDATTGTYGGANITAKLYDYYSDFELINGKPRYELSQSLDTHFSNTTNDTNGGYGWGIRRYIPMLTFNDKMSAVYKSYNTAHGSESFKPMYFGEFNQVSTYNSNSTVTSWYKYDSTNGFSDANLNAGQGYKEGLYANQLDSNHRPLVAGTTSLQVPFFDTSFLRGGTQKLGIVYSTTFPFYKDSEGYYLADCTKYVYRYNNNGINATAVDGTSSNAVLGTTTSAIADADFFPFDDRSHHNTSYAVGPYADRMNYGFGMELEIPFNLVNKGTEASPVFTDDSGNAITFEFNGDDDLVVYVDDLLILDVGGTHGKESGTINFNTSQVTVQGKYTNENFTNCTLCINNVNFPCDSIDFFPIMVYNG